MAEREDMTPRPTKTTLLKKPPQRVRLERELKAIVGGCSKENRLLTMAVVPPFENRVQQLCKQLVVCRTEAEVVELAEQLNALLDDRIEQLAKIQRGKI